MSDLFGYMKKSVWHTKAKSTIRNRESRWRNFAARYWAGRPLAAITRAEATEWFAERVRFGDVPSAQLTELKGDLFSMGERIGDLDPNLEDKKNPFMDIALPHQPGREKVTIGADILPVLEAVCSLLAENATVDDRRQPLAKPFIVEMWLVALFTGIRISEVIPLSPSQVDLDRGVLTVDRAMREEIREIPPGKWREEGDVKAWALHLPKEGLSDPDPRIRRVRRVPISNHAARVLRPIVERAQNAGQLLLWPDANGSPKGKKNIHKAFANLRLRIQEVAQYADPTLGPSWPTVPTVRGRARNLVVGIVREDPSLKLPKIFDGLEFRDSRNSFATLCNDIGMTDATRNAIMGHLPAGVGARHYIEITDAALQGARRLLSDSWIPIKDYSAYEGELSA